MKQKNKEKKLDKIFEEILTCPDCEIKDIFKRKPIRKGRYLGEGYAPNGITEELFNIQKKVNQSIKKNKISSRL